MEAAIIFLMFVGFSISFWMLASKVLPTPQKSPHKRTWQEVEDVWDDLDNKSRQLYQIKKLTDNGYSMLEAMQLADKTTRPKDLISSLQPVEEKYKINDDFGFTS